ncbi:MAG: lamin tail domain-containing protein, partial [Verrucomicrobiota bacterium]|nr:lamin tail domain-containing protein [Verrucomicrobiota bacterium]
MNPLIRFFLTSLTLTLAFSLSASPLVAQSLVISEFMASNQDSLTDEDGDTEDWIEILNPGETAVRLDGWFLTDDQANLNKWSFPDLNLGPGEHLVVFASSKNRFDPGGELHTNFKLTSSGEYLALVRPDGRTVAHEYAPSFPIQVQDVSYGLQQGANTTTLLGPGSPLRYSVPLGDED